MKVWRNPKGNWVIELEIKEDELTRLLYPLGEGIQEFKKRRENSELDRQLWIITALIKTAIEAPVVGSNYTQKYPTAEHPYETSIEKGVNQVVEIWDSTHWSVDGFDEEDIKLMREVIETGEYEELI